jgi:hypothetical protein
MAATEAMKKAQKVFKDATKLSEIALIALDDMEAMVNTKGYEIYMGAWHGPLKEYNRETDEFENTDVCGVCLAGSVMAKRFVNNPKTQKGADDFGGKLSWKFSAINSFREGEINDALGMLNSPLRIEGELENDYQNIASSFSSYSNRMDKPLARRFVKAMRKVANELKGLGL